MFLSDFIKNGSTLQAKAGAGAINSDDLLQLNALGQLFAAKTLDYAAVGNTGAIVATTTFSATPSSTNTGPRNQAVVQASDGAIFIADTNSAGPQGVQVWKYSATGAAQGTVVVDASGVNLSGNPEIAQLQNGNFVVLWAQNGAPNQVKFAIIDPSLNIVVAATVVGTSAVNPGATPYLIALAAGGFACSWTRAANGVYIAVYTNAGAVTLAATLVAGIPAQNSTTSLGAVCSLAQLSSGNIVMGVAESNAHTLGFATFTAAGVPAVAYTTIAAAGYAQIAGFPEIQVLPGFFCITNGRWCNASAANAYVYNNAGALQGAGYSLAGGNVSGGLTNDGTNFWYVHYNSAVTTAVKMPTTGTNYVSTTLATIIPTISYLFYDSGLNALVILDDTPNTSVIPIDAAGQASQVQLTAVATPGKATAVPLGDCAFLGVGSGAFTITKYAATALVGVSQQTLAAGNAGALVSYSMGPGGYPINTLRGSPTKAFDHTATSLLGNKGTLLGGTSVSLKGI